MWYVYVLRCNNNKLYTGCTGNLEERLQRHQTGRVISTARILPIQLLVSFQIPDKYTAYAFEKYLKSGSGRAFLAKRFLHPPKLRAQREAKAGNDENE